MSSLSHLGWDPFFEHQIAAGERPASAPARVVWGSREHYRLSTGDAEWSAQLTGRLRHQAATQADLPVVGDWVLAAFRIGEENAMIHRVLQRRTRFSRGAAGRSTGEQVVAANIDAVLVVTSFNRDFNPRRIERYLALVWESGATPIVVLNKADLCEDHERWLADIEPVSQGVRVILTSAVRGDGVEDLRGLVRTSGTTALVGSSGVGKSSLVNLLTGGSQDVLPIRTADDRGRHSTTSRQLFCLPRGGVLIDTPGMRELQMWEAEDGLGHAFADVQALAGACRFRDCSHRAEPGCAVTAAVEDGSLAADRLESYHRLLREDAYLRTRNDPGARVEQTRRGRQGAKAARLLYKLRRR